MSKKIRVGIMDDHPPIIEGYCSRLKSSWNIEVVGSVSRGEDLEPFLAQYEIDVLLLDVVVPVSDTNRAPYPILIVIPRLLRMYPELNVLVISMHSQQTLIRSVMEAGASGYILKDDLFFLQDLPTIVESVAHGGIYLSREANQQLFRRGIDGPQLTARELEVLSLCAAYPEATTAELARRLGVANSTIRNLLSGAYISLDVHSRIAAVAKAQQLGLIAPTSHLPNLADLGVSGPANRE